MALITLGANSGKGKVLQVVRLYVANQGGSHLSTTSTSMTASGIQSSITPTASGNLILVDFYASMTDPGGNAGMAEMHQKIGSGSFAVMAGAGNFQIGYTETRYTPMVLNASYTTTSTDTLTYQPFIRTGGAGTFNFIHDTSSYALTLTEVEQ